MQRVLKVESRHLLEGWGLFTSQNERDKEDSINFACIYIMFG